MATFYKRATLSLSLLFCSMLFAIFFMIAGCATTGKLENLNRSEIPQVNAGVSATTSEIREIKFYHAHKEDGHTDLHIVGQLFTKSAAGGTTQIKPCGNCIVKLTTQADTSIKINITTESDGYFTYHGQNMPYLLTIQNDGHNRMEIGPVDFTSEGATVLKIINATGSGTENFRVTRNGKNYTWQ